MRFTETQKHAMQLISDAITVMYATGSDYATDWAATLSDLADHPEYGDAYFLRTAREAQDVNKRRANLIG